MEEEDEKVFMFAGYTNQQLVIEKQQLTEKIEKLGGEIDDSPHWNMNCTHVIVHNYENFNAKVLACLASGGWVVTKRFVERSYKNGAWYSTNPFICNEAVRIHRELKQENGGCFKDMKVLFMMDSVPRVRAYTDVVLAGGGTVIQDKTFKDLINEVPGLDEISHIVADPYILYSNVDPRNEHFLTFKRMWSEKGVDIRGRFIYYRYFFDYLRWPEKQKTPRDYCLFDQKIVLMAKENNDFKRPSSNDTTDRIGVSDNTTGATGRTNNFSLGITNSAARDSNTSDSGNLTGNVNINKKSNEEGNCSMEEPKAGPSTGKRCSEEPDNSSHKRTRTVYKTVEIAPNVIELDEESDDDIEVLEERLAKNNGNKENRIYYENVSSLNNKKIINVNIEDSDIEDQQSKTDNDSVNEDSQEETACEERVDDDAQENNEIEIIGAGKHQPKEVVSTKKSKMFKEKLDKMKAREERRENKEAAKQRSSRKSRDSRSPEHQAPEQLPVIPTMILKKNIPKPDKPMNTLQTDDPMFHRLLASIDDKQEYSWDCIEVSYVTRRTAKYDKHREKLLVKKKIVPVEDRVREDFFSERFEKRVNELGDELDMLNISHNEDGARTAVALSEKLEYLKSYTDLYTHPTSFILHNIMRHFIWNQQVPSVALKSYHYINNIMFHFLGTAKENREEWLYLILTSMSDSTTNQRIDLESSPDIQSCYQFFSKVLQRATENDHLSTRLMLSLVVNICQRDFEIWWKHHRQTKQKDDREISYPILFYLLNGKRDLLRHINETVLRLYEYIIVKDVEVSSDARKLVSMCAMLSAYRDMQETKRGLFSKGLKHDLAMKISNIFLKKSETDLSDIEMFIELSLLQPSWLSQQVSKIYLEEKKKFSVNSVTDVIAKSSQVSESCDSNLVLVLDNFLIKSFESLHIHSIVRTHWHRQNSDSDYPVFTNTSKLKKVKDKQEKKAKLWKQANDVKFPTTTIISDINSMVSVINKEQVLPHAGVLKCLIFNMTAPDKF